MDYGIGSNAKAAAQHSLCGMIHLNVKDHLEKENKYIFETFWSPTYVESVLCLERRLDVDMRR